MTPSRGLPSQLRHGREERISVWDLLLLLRDRSEERRRRPVRTEVRLGRRRRRNADRIEHKIELRSPTEVGGGQRAFSEGRPDPLLEEGPVDGVGVRKVERYWKKKLINTVEQLQRWCV